jgi:hypothetical protein
VVNELPDPSVPVPTAPVPAITGPVPAAKLRGWLPMSLGVLALVVGALWTVQGLDVVTESAMSGKSIWAIVGVAIAAIGLILIILGVRVRSRAKR